MDDKLKATVQKIKQLAQQNPEFKEEMRKMFSETSSANAVSIDNDKIDHIYEYCIEEVIRKQANEFYKDFPIEIIKNDLVSDFVRMEFARRKDNFKDFCLALYQQIEHMTNHLCDNNMFDILCKLCSKSAYVDKSNPILLNRTQSTYTIEAIILGKGKFIKDIGINDLSAIQKIKIVLYFIGYKAQMVNSDFDNYNDIKNSLYSLYQCRNLNHRGGVQNESQQTILNNIIPYKSLYYFKFMGILAQYTEFIKNGITFLPEIKSYANSLN